MSKELAEEKMSDNRILEPTSLATAGLARLSHQRMLGYAVGDLGINLNFQLIGFYLAYFYTDVFGLTPTHVAGLFFAARVWDAFMDPIMGYIADHTRTRWGRFRPYLLFGALPLNLVLVACFLTPDASPHAKLIYAYVTYIMHGMVFSAVALPYSSISATMTQAPAERSVISTYRMFFAVIVAMSVVSIGVRPLVAQFSSERAGFFAVAVMFAVVSTVLLLFSFTHTEERVPPPREQYRVRDMFRIVLKNDALLMLSAAMFLNTCVWVIGSAVALYYFKYVVGNADLQTSFFFWMLPANIVGAALSPWLAKRIGKRNAFILGSFLVAFFYVIRHFVADQSLVAIISVSMAASFGQMLCSITQWAMLPDTVEYGHFRSGIRSEGLPFALFAFTQKLGMATGGALAALVMTFTGYAANANQSATALVGIRWLFNLVPALFSVACLLVLLVYKLDEKRYAEIQAALAKQESAS